MLQAVVDYFHLTELQSLETFTHMVGWLNSRWHVKLPSVVAFYMRIVRTSLSFSPNNYHLVAEIRKFVYLSVKNLALHVPFHKIGYS